MYSKYASALDDVLRSIMNATEDKKIYIDDILRNTSERYGISRHEANQVFTQLRNEDYIYMDENDRGAFKLRFKGYDFIKRGGFARELYWQNVNHYGKVIMNAFLTIGAGATLAIAIFESVKFCERNKKPSILYHQNLKPDKQHKGILKVIQTDTVWLSPQKSISCQSIQKKVK